MIPIFRDDDVFFTPGVGIKVGITDYFPRFMAVDKLIKSYGVKHTIAVLASGIDKEPEWVDYIKKGKFDIQLHGWDHLDFTINHNIAEEHFIKSLDKIESTFGIRPTIWYPPWNYTDKFLNSLAEKLGLKISFNKVCLTTFNKNPRQDLTINFHYWADIDIARLEEALKIVKEKGWI